MSTKIEWTDETWNPVTGCDRISTGCDHCYIERTFPFRKEGRRFDDSGRMGVRLHRDRLEQPLHWAKPRRVFVCSLADLFHQDVPDEYIAEVFAVMAQASEHTFQVLTKRPQRMAALLGQDPQRDDGWHIAREGAIEELAPADREAAFRWPLPNVWLGVSAENQRYADLRIPHLLATPAWTRFLSIEPLLGPVDLDLLTLRAEGPELYTRAEYIRWVIVGGESGPGARPMHPEWARSLRDQCTDAGVPFFFKQWGEHVPVRVEDDPTMSRGRAFDNPRGGRTAAVMRERADRKHTFRGGTWRLMEPGDENGHGVMLDRDTIAVRVGKKAAGRELDGRTWDEMPEPAR